MPKLLTRKQNRLPNYDYSNEGFYFVTICSKDRKNIFAKINNKNVVGTGLVPVRIELTSGRIKVIAVSKLCKLKNVQIIGYIFKCFVQCLPKKGYLRHLNCLNLPGNFLFMDYIKGFPIFQIKSLKKYFWSVLINVTTGIIKKGYSGI